jgi:hypothetical protein
MRCESMEHCRITLSRNCKVFLAACIYWFLDQGVTYRSRDGAMND